MATQTHTGHDSNAWVFRSSINQLSPSSDTLSMRFAAIYHPDESKLISVTL